MEGVGKDGGRREMDTLKMVKELARSLECPVCFEFVNYPVFTCVIGHLICSRCRNFLTSCPLCRETFTGTRSFIAEQSVSTVTEYLRSTSSQISGTEHAGNGVQNNTSSMPVKCCLAVNGCRNKLMDSSDYINHLKDHHAAFVAYSLNGSYTKMISLAASGKCLVKRGTDRLFILATQQKSFVVNMLQEGQEVRVWVFTDINPMDTHRKVEISILDANNQKRISWAGRVNPIQVTDQSVGMSGNCLKTTIAQLKDYLHHDNGKYCRVHVKILNSSPSTLAKLRQKLVFENLSVIKVLHMGFCIFASILFIIVCV